MFLVRDGIEAWASHPYVSVTCLCDGALCALRSGGATSERSLTAAPPSIVFCKLALSKLLLIAIESATHRRQLRYT